MQACHGSLPRPRGAWERETEGEGQRPINTAVARVTGELKKGGPPEYSKLDKRICMLYRIGILRTVIFSKNR